MGYPVVHFEVIGKDAGKLQDFYSKVFEWEMNTDNPMDYGTVERYTNPDGAGIGGGVGTGPEGYDGHVTFYVEVPDIETTLQQVETLGGKRLMGPDQVMEGLTIGQFADPEGRMIGLVQAAPR